MCFGINFDLVPFLEKVNDFQVPPCFDRGQLVSLSTFGMGWWDKTHKQCFIGNCREGQTEQHLFAQNENGDYDENGTYRDREVALQVKFSKETHLLLGVASVKDGMGEHRVHLEPLDYMEKVVITLKEPKNIIENEKLRAKTLPCMTKGWFKNQC